MVNCVTIQDTLKLQKVAGRDSLKSMSDSSGNKTALQKEISTYQTVFNTGKIENKTVNDTATYCIRNSIADITFHDESNFITGVDESTLQSFPDVFTETIRKSKEETKATLVKNLKTGDELALVPYHYDWVLPVILTSILFYLVIKTESGKLFHRVYKFLSPQSAADGSSRDTSSLFNWQSSLFNLASFLNIALFAFFSAQWYEILPLSGAFFINWLIILVVIISAFSLRIFTCFIIGSVTGEREVFRDYIFGIFQAYRLAGIGLLIINILIVYSDILPERVLFYTGFSLVAVSYFIRAIKLFIIFINRHIPIFYLILYLCALEILPVVIIVKFITGLV